uniref:Graves disease carrier protein (inferred by orthology to a human protein) n=1 Tax=Strongyloides venezuelensis TaxID=75913 RepID=A0A0K0FXI3_STRVS
MNENKITPRKRGHMDRLASGTAGALAGSISKTIIAPLDRTKINFQVSKRKQYSLRGAMRFVVKTFKQEGFTALFRGNSATLIRVAPYATIQFAAHEEYKVLFGVDRSGEKTPIKRFIAGSCSSLTATLITFPLDVMKARLATTTKNEYKNLRYLVMKNYRDYGWTTFYRGIVPTIWGVIPYAGCSFFTYETSKLMYKDKTGCDPSALLRMIFGATGGLIGQAVTYPLDIVRRRMQTGVVPRGQSIKRTVIEIYRNEGIVGGLYKGLSMNWIKGPIAVGVSFATYDLIHIHLREILNLSLQDHI